MPQLYEGALVGRKGAGSMTTLTLTLITFWLLILAMAHSIIKARKAPKVSPLTPPVPPVHPCASFHTFEPITACPLDGPALAYKHTSLLMRCRICGQHDTKVFPGDFQLSDFVARTNEIERLKEMAR